MQITDELIEKAEAELSAVLRDYTYVMPTDGMRRVLTAALSDQERAVEVKALEWVGDGDCYAFADVIHQSYSIAYEEGKYWANWNMSLPPFDTLEAAQAAAQADYEQRIRSALVDVPAVGPVAIYHGNGLIDCGDAGHHNLELLKLIPAGTKLYTRPPHREGEDSAEVDRLTRPIVGIENRTAQEVFDIMADRIRLAATRSASATSTSGTSPICQRGESE